MKKNLYLFEISDIFANQVYLPYSSGVVWSYAQSDEKIKNSYELSEWFFYRQDAEKIINSIKNPDVLAFSCFMWNWNINCEIAQRVKKKYPNCLIIFGGQHQPLADRNDKFFQEHPYVDILVHGEGEETFKEILLNNLEKIPDFKSINGLTLNIDNTEFRTYPRQRISNIQDSESPYLNGLFDELIKKENEKNSGIRFSAIVESARGCPYSCAFCEIGEKYYQKLKTSYDKTKQEIDWIAKNNIEYVTDANSNFGILFKQDLDLAEYVGKIKEKYSYPHAYRVTWAKGKADKVLEIAKIFEKAKVQKGMTIALQSMNPNVLKAIARKNIDGGKLDEFIEMYEGENIASYIELIWGLPEETLDSFIDGACKIMEKGYHNYLDIHLMMLLPNAPIGSDNYMSKYGIITKETQPRFSHRHVTEELSTDTAKFVTQTNTFTEEEWIQGHHFRWLIIFGHYLGPLQFIARSLNEIYGVSYKDFYMGLMNYTKQHQDTFLGEEYNRIDINLRKIIKNERHWGDVLGHVSDINWEVDESTCIRLADPDTSKRFYKEIRVFCDILLGEKSDRELLNDIFRYQKLRLHSFDKNYPIKDTFTYNIDGVVERKQNLKKKKNSIIFNGKNYNSDLFKWAKEILWYGRRVAAYKTQTMVEAN